MVLKAFDFQYHTLLMKPSGLADRYGSVGQTTVPVSLTLSVLVSSMNFFLANGSLAVPLRVAAVPLTDDLLQIGTGRHGQFLVQSWW